MQYPLCDRTVTVYRREDGTVQRRVLEGCFYRWSRQLRETPAGKTLACCCLLVVPGADFIPRIGDRVLEGIGPETVDWEQFLPVHVEGLSELSYAEPQYWAGKLCHTEAGSK